MKTEARSRAMAVLGVCALLAAGCSQKTFDSAGQDAQHNVAVVDREAQRAARKARPQLDKLDLGARVTAAITASRDLRGTAIRVDAGNGGVTLRGAVKTDEQKSLAERVARDTLGPDKTVSNQLTVRGG